MTRAIVVYSMELHRCSSGRGDFPEEVREYRNTLTRWRRDPRIEIEEEETPGRPEWFIARTTDAEAAEKHKLDRRTIFIVEDEDDPYGGEQLYDVRIRNYGPDGWFERWVREGETDVFDPKPTNLDDLQAKGVTLVDPKGFCS